MSKSKNQKNKPKVTDWIQAISAAISIPAAIIAFFAFFQKDLQLQKQINSLDTISKQGIEQTKILTNQLEILKDEIDFQRKQSKLQGFQRKSEIEPKFSIKFDLIHEELISAKMINTGKSARIIEIKEKKDNDFDIDIPFKFIGDNKEREIYFRLKDSKDIHKAILNFNIKYEDIDKNEYSKDFYFEEINEIVNEKMKNIIPNG